MAAITASVAAPIIATNDSKSSFYLVENDSIEIIDRIGCSSDDTESSNMNTPFNNNNNSNIEANGHLNSRPHETPLHTQSLVITSKTSLIDNTLAQGYSLKRARSSPPSDMKKSNSDGMIGTKRMKLPSYCPTTVVISSSNSSSLSSSSSLPPEENLCPYSFIESLLNDSGSCSTNTEHHEEQQQGLLSSNNSSSTLPLLLSQQPLTDDDFSPPTPEMIEAYSNDALSAVRSSDVHTLRQLHSAGHSLQCCNRFGESLLHVACRRSNATIVAFLLNEAKVSPCIRDDYGRTPLHDACWRGNPEYEIVELLLSVEPRLAFVKDVRGHRPFQYARREHWSCWRKFLDEKRELILRS